MSNTKRSPASPEWARFAEQIVDTAGILDDDTADLLFDSFASVPRSLFVPESVRGRAMEDIVLPVSYGQTTAAPSTIARMLGVIGLVPEMKILEIGCGAGYASAIMAAAGAYVFAVESVGLLAQTTRKLLDTMKFQNVIVRCAHGRSGWAEHAPYDAIVFSKVVESVNPEIINQLAAPDGKLIAPVGDSESQVLTLWQVGDEGVSEFKLEQCNLV